MNSSRKIAIITGVLFIIGTVAGVLSVVFTGSILNSPDYLVKISANENSIITGAFFQLIMALSCASIAISLYPVLRKYNKGLALGAAGFRIIEGVIGIVGTISLILLLTVSREFIKAGTPANSYFQTIGSLLLAERDWIGNVILLLPWCIGAIMYYYIFFQTKLIPRWLSLWGLTGIALTIASCIFAMYHSSSSVSTVQSMLNIPIAIQEMVLAVWLIVRGFNPAVIASGAGKTDINQTTEVR